MLLVRDLSAIVKVSRNVAGVPVVLYDAETLEMVFHLQ